jgi:hypothetical protein
MFRGRFSLKWILNRVVLKEVATLACPVRKCRLKEEARRHDYPGVTELVDGITPKDPKVKREIEWMSRRLGTSSLKLSDGHQT